MARFLIFLSIACLFTDSLSIPLKPRFPTETSYAQVNSPIDLTSPDVAIERPLFPNPTPRTYENFANNALYYGFNTAKVGSAVGIFCLVLTVTERCARWVYRYVRGSIRYWKDEIADLRNGGKDPYQIALEKEEFVNDAEGWESPVIEKRN
jgi:hypothetical protein